MDGPPPRTMYLKLKPPFYLLLTSNLPNTVHPYESILVCWLIYTWFIQSTLIYPKLHLLERFSKVPNKSVYKTTHCGCSNTCDNTCGDIGCSEMWRIHYFEFLLQYYRKYYRKYLDNSYMKVNRPLGDWWGWYCSPVQRHGPLFYNKCHCPFPSFSNAYGLLVYDQAALVPMINLLADFYVHRIYQNKSGLSQYCIPNSHEWRLNN